MDKANPFEEEKQSQGMGVNRYKVFVDKLIKKVRFIARIIQGIFS